jgi:hypothetical protein
MLRTKLSSEASTSGSHLELHLSQCSPALALR